MGLAQGPIFNMERPLPGMSVVASDIVFVPSGRYRPDLAPLPDRDATGARSSPQEPGQRDPAAAPSARNTRVKKVRNRLCEET
ncbi:hypothetical protein FJT64_025607 [Amphibalanus amphitrite]|uniref:Uncharacterized protein n=1 Tax=Amphibalanus amphitrite TaxID=1232801 RepID=A0A6A4WAU4_AMPAM|nr:hypothetical protein FJT64_025607 [Amphibalanus amphitrite]